MNAIYRGMWSAADDGETIRAMRRVVRNPHEARELGQEAAKWATKYRWEDTMRKLVIALIRNGFIRPGR